MLQPSPSEAQSALTAGVQVAVDAEAQAAVAAAAAAPAAAAAAAAPLSPEAALEALLASTHDPFLSDADMRRGLVSVQWAAGACRVATRCVQPGSGQAASSCGE